MREICHDVAAERRAKFHTENMPRPLRRRTFAAALVCGALLAAIAGAQRGFRGGGVYLEPNVPYDGRFTFVRLRYQFIIGRGWEFDYPAMERNLMFMVRELTSIRPHLRQSNVLDMDDPELAKYPAAYLSEPGYWVPNASEAAGLRDWMHKGGFLIVDDFYGNQWANFERSMRRVLPDVAFIRLDRSHPIFNSF